jgi:hypothetical protein
VTFARLAKLAAVLLLAFALWQLRPPAAPANVAILALPGAARDTIASTAGREGSVRAPAGRAGSTFWREVFSFGVAAEEPHAPLFLWTGDRPVARPLAVPVRLFRAPGSTMGDDGVFVGTSSGAVVDAADITTGRLPSPYDRAIDAVAASAAMLRPDEWSDWITVEPVSHDGAAITLPEAEFQFARTNDSSYLFSPAYVAHRRDRIGTPFLRGADREARPLVAQHLFALSKRRLQPVETLFAPGGDRRPLVVFDMLAEEIPAVFAPDSTPAASLDQIRDAVLGEIELLRKAVGPDGIVVTIGGPSSGRSVGEPAWYRVDRGAGGPPLASGVADGATLRSLVRYVAGVAIDQKEKALLPGTLLMAVPVRPGAARPDDEGPELAADRDWSPSSLESIPGAVSGG